MRLNLNGRIRPYTNRTAYPTKYYIIDFGLSRQYDADVTSPREILDRGGDHSLPEVKHADVPCDPFKTDIYYVGNTIRANYLQVRNKLPRLGYVVLICVPADFAQPGLSDSVGGGYGR